MAVYVDDMRAGFGSMVMSHMIADSTVELLAMADLIGVQRKWMQKGNTWEEHFDVCQSKRAAAVRHGAQQITLRELAKILTERRRVERPEETHNGTER
jgi:hypothetical protein